MESNLTDEEVFMTKVMEKIIDLAYCIVEWDSNERRDKKRGHSNYNRDPKNEQVAGAGETAVTITDIGRSFSKAGDPMVVIESQTLDGEELQKKYFSFNTGGIYYCRRDFMSPLGHTEFTKNTPITDYEDFNFESYQGKTMKVKTKFNDKGQLEISKFLKVIKEDETSSGFEKKIHNLFWDSEIED